MSAGDVYKTGETLEIRGHDVYVRGPMTEYEMAEFTKRAERLVDQLEVRLGDYPIDFIRAYGSQGRVGVRIKPGDDPLGNGIITGNLEGFSVEAVNPVDHETVFIRFQQERDVRVRFNDAVAQELKDRGRLEVAEMSREYDRDVGSMSAATLAQEEGVPLDADDEDAVATVADARIAWHDDTDCLYGGDA